MEPPPALPSLMFYHHPLYFPTSADSNVYNSQPQALGPLGLPSLLCASATAASGVAAGSPATSKLNNVDVS